MWKQLWMRLLVLCLSLSLTLAGCGDMTPDSSVDSAVGDTSSPDAADKKEDVYENVPGQIVQVGQVYTSKQTYTGLEMPALPEAGDITARFDADTGILFVNGTGPITRLYPRTITYPHCNITDLDVVQIDTMVKHIIIGEGITGIYNSFNDMKALTGITFPSSLKTIQDSFIDCDSLTSVVFPSELELLRNACFMDCDALTSIKFNSPVIMDHPIAYVTYCPEGCNGDKDTYESWGWTPAPFFSLDALQEVHIYGGSALYSAFTGCKNLRKVTLGVEGGAPVLVTGKGDEAYEWPLMPAKAAAWFGRPFDGGHKELMVYTTAYCYGTAVADGLREPFGYRTYFTMDWIQERYPEDYPLDSIVRVHFLKQVPEELTATGLTSGIRVSWPDVDGAGRYYVYRQAEGESTWTFMGDTERSSYMDTSIPRGFYRYALKAVEYKVSKRTPSADNPSAIENDYVQLYVRYDYERPVSACIISNKCTRK